MRNERIRTVILSVVVYGCKSCSVVLQVIVNINIQKQGLGFWFHCGDRYLANTHTDTREI
jgi:hypothetical protein